MQPTLIDHRAQPLTFLLKGIFFSGLFLLLYDWMLPAYVAVISGLCATMSTAGPFGIILTAHEDGWKVAIPSASSAFLFGNHAFTGRLFFNITLLPALILATPMGMRQRIALVLGGELLLLPVNAALLVISAQGIASLCYPDLSTRGCRVLAGLPGPLGAIVTFALWLLLVSSYNTWRGGAARRTPG